MKPERVEKNRISLCEPADCLGCMACYNACTKEAIQMQEDRQGEMKPVIDYSKCVSCGKCRKACPVLRDFSGNRPSKGYACYTRNEQDATTCSSGGIATTFYRAILERGGRVAGAAENGLEPPALRLAEREDEIEKFKGSKYVYVEPQLIYREIEQELKSGKECLFIGTPCQVDALRCYLNKDYENLYAVDIICHGTPPFRFLHDYMIHLSKEAGQIQTYSFRGKYDYFLTLYDSNGIIYKKNSDEDPYFRAFIYGLIHRDNCYKCPYSQEKRISDITIGDYWGAPPKLLNGYKGKVSAVLINSDKGQRLWNNTSGRLVFEETPVDAIIQGNSQLRKPSVKHPERDQFLMKIMETGSFVSALYSTSIISDTHKARVMNILLFIPRLIKHGIAEPLINHFM